MNSNASASSSQSRRRFLSNCSRASLAVALTPWLFSKTEAATRIITARPLWLDAVRHAASHLSYSQFAAHLNTSFYVQQYSLNLVLVDAVDQLDASNTARPNNRSAKDEMFSLTFAGPTNRILSQGTYSFQHRKMGVFEMFIVPTYMPDGVTYEASFNRINLDTLFA